MAAGHRLTHYGGHMPRPHSAATAFFRLGVVLLLATATVVHGEGMPDLQAEQSGVETVPIIVHLKVTVGSDGRFTTDAVDAVRRLVMARLEPLMSDNEAAAVRIYENLPAIALTARSEVIAQLLTMPDVLSIEPDRELSQWTTPSFRFD